MISISNSISDYLHKNALIYSALSFYVNFLIFYSTNIMHSIIL